MLLCPGAFESGYTPAAGTEICGWNTTLEASFLYWQAREKGIDFAYVIPQNPNLHTGPNIEKHYNYHPGFRVAVDVDTRYDGWSGTGMYSRVYFSESRQSGTPDWALGMMPTHMPLPGEGGPATSSVTAAHSHFQVHYNMFDLLLTRPSYLSRTLIFSPFYGFRGGWVNQKWDVTYTITGSGDISNRYRLRNFMFGPRIGFSGELLVGYGIRFEGVTAGSLLIQDAKVYMKRQNYLNPSSLSINASDKIRYFAPNLDLAFGMGWGSYFHKQRWYLDLSLNYEIQYYYSQNWMRHIKDAMDERNGSAAGDLYIHGFTATCKVDF